MTNRNVDDDLVNELQEANVAPDDTDSSTTHYGPGIEIVAQTILTAITFGFYYLITSPAQHSNSPSTDPQSGGSPAPGSSAFWIVIIVVTAVLVHALLKKETRKHWVFFRQIRASLLLQNAFVLAATVTTGLVLEHLLPGLDRSWLYRFPVADGESANLILLPTMVKYLAPVYIMMFILCIPAFAYDEEVSYRNGTKNWIQGVFKSIRFGLRHCIMGIPLHYGLAIGVAGMWFMRQYFRGGVERSTLHHLTYNLIIAAVLLIIVLMNGFAL